MHPQVHTVIGEDVRYHKRYPPEIRRVVVYAHGQAGPACGEHRMHALERIELTAFDVHLDVIGVGVCEDIIEGNPLYEPSGIA